MVRLGDASIVLAGATGAILVVKALHELAPTMTRYALITLCIGGGQGIAAVIERQ